jgi:hypothetical protein
MKVAKPYPHILRAAEIEARQRTFSHPWNPKLQATGSRVLKLRTGCRQSRRKPSAQRS